MLRKWVLVFGLFLSACDPSQASIETAIAQTESAKPTQARPTRTPTPNATEDRPAQLLEVIRGLDNPDLLGAKYKNDIEAQEENGTLRFIFSGDAEPDEDEVGLAAELLGFGARVTVGENWEYVRIEFVSLGPLESYVLYYVTDHDTFVGIRNDTISIWDVMQVYIEWGNLPPTPTGTIENLCPYTVQRGDTLAKIGRQFGVSWQEIQALNNLPDPNRIEPGDELLIPVPCVAEGKNNGGETQITSPTATFPPPPTTSPCANGGCIYPPPGCDIKGNISFNSGEKIYHVPGGEFYDSTVINPDFDERWFCTEDEAVANGWRRSQR